MRSRSIFHLLADTRSLLYATLITPPAKGEFAPACIALAEQAQEACRLDPDAAIASILLDRAAPYTARQAVNCAIVAELVLRHREPDAVKRRPVIAAALTMNIAMAALQEELYHQQSPLTPEQRQAVRDHPRAGVEQLSALGVSEPAWLAVVGAHHESIDGSGYPAGLAGTEVSQGAQVLGLADRYCAMIAERAYRPGTLPNQALGKVFLNQGKVDAMLVGLLVKELGIYPPGSIVTLKTREIAVVVKRTQQANHPVVKSLVSSSTDPLKRPVKRLTSEPIFAVESALPRDQLKVPIEPSALWEDAVEVELDAPAA